MKILSIGNSFSQDAHKWLSQIAESCADEIYAVNLYIGGCALGTHWENYINQAVNYDLEINGDFVEKISLNAALRLQEWDVITFQQASPLCGDYSTYQPYLRNLIGVVRENCPKAKLYIHQTWSYEVDCSLEAFDNYQRSQSVMQQRLEEAYTQASREMELPLIPCGDVIRYLRENMPEFDYQKGGLSLNRDGFHLSWIYGRYAAALVWYIVLAGGDPRAVRFVPTIEGETTDEALLGAIGQAVYAALKR